MPTIGYGEDGLTYWALHQQRPHVLQALADNTPAENCTVFFRPSFGRSGGNASPQFGEFDSILATSNFIYLIESKWDNCQPTRSRIVVEEVQRTRHRIFAWLYNSWCDGQGPTSWMAYQQRYAASFADMFPIRPMAPNNSLLARNLFHILAQLAQPRRPIVNVLLYFHRQDTEAIPAAIVKPDGTPVDDPPYVLVSLAYQSLGNSGYFTMNP